MDGNTDQANDAQESSDRGGTSVRRYRTVVIAVTLLVAASLAVMLFVHKSSEVEINLKVSQMSFKITDERAKNLFNSVPAKLLAVSTFKEINLGTGALDVTDEVDSRTGEPVNWRRVNRPANYQNVLTPQEGSSNVIFETVNLHRLEVPLGATAIFSRPDDEPSSMKLSFDRTVTGEFAGEKTLRFSCNYCRLQDDPSTDEAPSLHFRLTSQHDGGSTVYFTGADNATVIGLDLPPDPNFKGQNILLTNPVDFTKREGERAVSTVIEGKIKFEDTGKEINVGEGVFVVLCDLENVTLRVAAVDKGINCTLNGRFGKLMTGTESSKRDRTPTLLEWVAARHTWVLYVEALMFIVSLLLGLHRWWKYPHGGNSSQGSV